MSNDFYSHFQPGEVVSVVGVRLDESPYSCTSRSAEKRYSYSKSALTNQQAINAINALLINYESIENDT